MQSSTQLLSPSPSVTLSLLALPSNSPQSLCPSLQCPPPPLVKSRRMATTSNTTSALTLSFDDLSSELVALVFEQLRDVEPSSLHSVRLVSTRFNAIATPIAYQRLTLNGRLVAPDFEPSYPRALHNISLYTNHVIVPSNLIAQGITYLLHRIRRLQSICWRYVNDDPHHGGLWLPSDVLNLDDVRFRSTKLRVENLPMCDLDNHLDNHLSTSYTQAIPPKYLTSLKLASPAPALSARLGSLKQLLLESPGLETLHYQDRGQGTSFRFTPGERMPAFTNLLLRSYDWNHSAEDVRKHWDFSQIQSLQLESVPIFNFLRSVSFDDFANLRTLRAEDYSAHLPDMREEATKGLYVLIKNHTKALQVLDITCHTQLFPLDALMVHRRSLQVLRLRDHAGFAEDDQRCPTLWVGDLEVLASHLLFVHTLEVDMDIAMCDPVRFLRTICRFPALHTLTLHVQTVVRPMGIMPPGADSDYEAAMDTFRKLMQGKQLHGNYTSWKRIVIIVGGWRRVMVRRLGSAWRRQNEMGVFAERCFVLERSEEEIMGVREEMCVETTSRRASPSP